MKIFGAKSNLEKCTESVYNNIKNDIKEIFLKHEKYEFTYYDLRDILEEISREICTEIINARPSKYTKRKK
jgi:hypothetical protein